MGFPRDLTGVRFGRLVCIRTAGKYELGREWIWLCRCDCGKETRVRRSGLVHGLTRSCGCLQRDRARQTVIERNTGHGAANSRLYRIWHHMKWRCTNPRCAHYDNYGGRGVQLAEDWHGFEPFQAWALTHGYTDELTIERINVDGDYCPENCAWIPRASQARNTRRTARLTFRGRSKPLPEWAEELGMSPSTIRSRLARGWDVSRTLATPVRKLRKPTYVAGEGVRA